VPDALTPEFNSTTKRPLKKPLLLAHCIAFIDASIADIKKQMSELVTEAQNDSKSTAGDKHETARAMMQLAQEQLGKQLQEAEIKRNSLTRIDASTRHKSVADGSLVTTTDNLLFIATPLGKIQFNEKDVFVISAQSPLGKLLLGKSAGETVSFNQRNISILDVA
jgi:transcription elongation GreA/GreB family factor